MPTEIALASAQNGAMKTIEERSRCTCRGRWRRCGGRLAGAGVILALLCGSVHREASADSFRCGRRVVRTGDTSAQLLSRCGEPLRQDFATEQFWLDGGLQKVRVERWHYKPGSRKLGVMVFVYRGKIVAVRTGDR